MRALRWIVLAAAVGLVVVGCDCINDGTPGTTPTPITSISGPVEGFTGSANAAFEARDFPSNALLASGTLHASASRFDAVFEPLATVPWTVLTTPTPPEEFCNVTVTPATLRTTGFIPFDEVDGPGSLVLANHEPSEGPAAAGMRIYQFMLASQAGSVRGLCEFFPSGVTLGYDIELVQGWNTVAWIVTAVDGDGNATSTTFRNETPVANAAWYYLQDSSSSVRHFGVPGDAMGFATPAN